MESDFPTPSPPFSYMLKRTPADLYPLLLYSFIDPIHYPEFQYVARDTLTSETACITAYLVIQKIEDEYASGSQSMHNLAYYNLLIIQLLPLLEEYPDVAEELFSLFLPDMPIDLRSHKTTSTHLSLLIRDEQVNQHWKDLAMGRLNR